MGYKKSYSKLRILVLGYIVRGPIAGMTWHHIQYVIGLHALGHEVHYHEDSGNSSYCCYNPETGITNDDPSYGLSYIKNIFLKLLPGLEWTYFDHQKNTFYSKNGDHNSINHEDFDLLINLSLSNQVRQWMLKIPKRVLIDTDPVFTQIRNLQNPERMELSLMHNVFFTFGELISSLKSRIPSDGFNWIPTRQPVVMDLWPNDIQINNNHYTTIMQWESYSALQHDGICYGVKADSFKPYMDLPTMTQQGLEIALGSPAAPRETLREKGWNIINPNAISIDPWIYQDYIHTSKAEFSIAKEAYVMSLSGWFSERSTAYLACGKPVLAQDTGFSSLFDTGFGLLSFSTPNEAVQAIEEINSNYKKHCEKAREIVSTFFNANDVLKKIIETSMN